MLRAAFALAALSAVAARHDEARHEHEHDERHCVDHIPSHERDLIKMQIGTRAGTNLITCNQMQTEQYKAHEDDKHGQGPRTYHTAATSEPSNAPIGVQSSWHLLQNNTCCIANCWWMVRREHSDFSTGTKTYSSARPIFGTTQCSRGRTTETAANVTMSQHHQNQASMTNCW